MTHTRVAAFFDLDKTIVAKSTTLAFSRTFAAQGLINRRSVLKSSYAHFLVLLTAADDDQVSRMRDFLTAMAAGWPVEQVKAVVRETLHDIVDPLVYAEAANLIKGHHARGHEVIIVSASGEEIVAPIGAMLGADLSIATKMAIADGKYTGNVDFYCYGANKATAIETLAQQRGYALDECFAYSDSHSDIPMLSAVGHPTAVNPDRALRKAADEHGWPVLSFSKPISLRERISPPKRSVMASFAVGGGAALAGAAAYAVLQRKKSSQHP